MRRAPVAAQAFEIAYCLRAEAEGLLETGSTESLPLSLEESAFCAGLAVPKRRLDWLAGRVAAKRALSAYFLRTRGTAPALAELVILNESTGRPYCRFPGAPVFSLSHCALGAVCAAGRGGRLVGADWETLALREPRVLEMFAHDSERGEGLDRSALRQTRLWASKEAVLKLLGIGLACDPRDVRLTPGLSLHGAALARLRELGSPQITLTEELRPDSIIVVAATGEQA